MSRKLTVFGLIALFCLVVPAHAQVLYGISNGFGSAPDTQIYQINPANGDLTNMLPVTMPGATVGRALAMAANPVDGTLFAVLQTNLDTSTNRRLAIINPSTGVATSIGSLGQSFATLAFRSNGTLYGVTGQLGANPETLFTINTSNATITLQFPLGNGADGESIAFHADGFLYHSSGNATALFERVNVDNGNIVPIGQSSPEMFAMGYHPILGQLLGSDISSQLFSIDIATGARTQIGDMSDQLTGSDNRGLAFVAAIPEPSTWALLGFCTLSTGAYTWKKRRQNIRKSFGRLK